MKVTNPVAVGDHVLFEREDSSEGGIIKEICDRKNYVIRQSPRKKHNLHILAANIDQAMLIVTIIEPNLKQGFIDRFLLMTEPYNIPVNIVFNKSDLYGESELAMFHYLKSTYDKIGYKCYLVSAVDNSGIAALKTVLQDKVSLIAGQSGVGKSSIINALAPHLDLKTKQLSKSSGKGQHTTTFAEMMELDVNTKIIDTPGIKTLSYNHLEVIDVAHNFREFFEYSNQCKFSDCTHRNEPHCAVKTAIENNEISELRYINYLQILDEIEDQNYWERNIDY